ncbi:MAG: hypothetical protein ACOX2X_05135 [Peptococcia bacterium]
MHAVRGKRTELASHRMDSETQEEQAADFHNDIEVQLEEIKTEISRALQEEIYKKKAAKSITAQEDNKNEDEIALEMAKESIEIIETLAKTEEPQEPEKENDTPEKVGYIAG